MSSSRARTFGAGWSKHCRRPGHSCWSRSINRRISAGVKKVQSPVGQNHPSRSSAYEHLTHLFPRLSVYRPEARISSTVITEPRSCSNKPGQMIRPEPRPRLLGTIRVQSNNSRCLPVSECFRYVVVCVLVVFNVDVREPSIVAVQKFHRHLALRAVLFAV